MSSSGATDGLSPPGRRSQQRKVSSDRSFSIPRSISRCVKSREAGLVYVLCNWVEFHRMAGAERFELSTVGFGDRCSTARTTPLLVNAQHHIELNAGCKEIEKSGIKTFQKLSKKSGKPQEKAFPPPWRRRCGKGVGCCGIPAGMRKNGIHLALFRTGSRSCPTKILSRSSN